MAGLDGYTGGGLGDAKVQRMDGLRMMRGSPLLEEAFRYWASLRSGGGLPRRADLDPVAMRRVLGHAMILDRVRHGAIRVRLGGHVMQDIMGMEVRGLPVRAFFDLADRTRVGALIEEVFETPSTLELDLISEGSDGLVTGRMIVLPLLDASGAVSKALTVMVTDRAVTDAPRRFAVTNAVSVPVNASAPRRDDVPQRRLTDRHLPTEIMAGLAEAAAPYDAKPTAVPWLRVVK